MTYWKDKVAIVTGGSAGLGFGIAKALIERDATVALVARDERRLQQARDQLGERVRIFPTDITIQAQVNQLQENVFEELGHVDALINCAGKSARGEILKTTPEDFQQLFEVNFLGLVRCTRAFMPSLIESKGHLVNIGSLAAKSTSRYLGAYPATKFPVAAYSQQLRLELSSEGVHVLLACPGPIARADAGVRYDDSAIPHSAKRPGGGVMLKGLDPNKLVNRILLACEKRQLELIIPGKVKLLFVISQISPKLGDWLIMRMTS